MSAAAVSDPCPCGLCVARRDRNTLMPIARDLLASFKREGACPLCGTITPPCSHVVAVRKVLAPRTAS